MKTNIILEQLNHENYVHACEINRDDIPVEWVDTAATIMDINDYGVENHLIGHTFLARTEDKYIGLIMVAEALSWETDPIEMRGIPFYRLMGFVIDKEYRNRGLGGAIMEKAIEQVYQEFGRRSLALGVHKDNTQAGRFYERHGFRKTGVFEGDDEYYLRLIGGKEKINNMAQDYFRKINYYETDKMGITHHSNYVRIMEEARINFLEQIGCSYEKMEKEGIVSPVIGIECEYKRTTTFNDELRIQVEIVEYKGVKLSVAYKMINTKTEEIVFVGKSRHCFLNKEGKPIALSKQYPAYSELLKAHVIDNG